MRLPAGLNGDLSCQQKELEIPANREDEPQGRRPEPSPMRFASMGFELAAAIVGLTLAGLWFDYHFHTLPVGVLVGAGLGIVGGLYNFFRAAQKMTRDEADRQRGGPGKE